MMQVKKYIAATFAEALIQAKNELGTEAMIVESKKLRVGGMMGFFRRQVTELTVAYDQTMLRKPARTPGKSVAAAATPATPMVSANINNLEREIATLKAMVSRLAVPHAAEDPPLELTAYGRQVFETLLSRGTDEETARLVGKQVTAEGEDGQEQLRRELSRLVGAGAPISAERGGHKVVALVGPTGVGKTTTLAKLAARFTLERGLSVALVTADTFRIAAIDQLRTYADILGVPLYAVDTPSDVGQVMRETARHDLVLVDTGGRNHHDEVRMQELKELMAVVRPDETHLVFSLTASPRDAFEALESYIPMGVNRLTFTKLDEAASPGLILSVRTRCSHPVGYITNGQSVPEDIIPADRLDFTKVLVGV